MMIYVEDNNRIQENLKNRLQITNSYCIKIPYYVDIKAQSI